MSNVLLGLLAETSIHPGAGRDLGVIDLPVAREAATDYPVLVGSGVKGAFRDTARMQWPAPPPNNPDDAAQQDDSAEVKRLFGKQEEAGQILFSDARLLLLPVRSLSGQYRWITCPHIIERLQRDIQRIHPNQQPAQTVNIPPAGNNTPAGNDNRAALAQVAEQEGRPTLFLEEWQFTVTGPIPAWITNLIKPLIKHEATRNRLASQLVVLSNDDFSWFARYGLSVQARNVLDPQKKTSNNLWYEETLPPDTLMYTMLQERIPGAMTTLNTMLGAHPYLQLGGNETVGQGWFSVQKYTPPDSNQRQAQQDQAGEQRGQNPQKNQQQPSQHHKGGKR